MTCWALVPVKARGEGKQRLASVLGAPARARLVQVMLDHVTAVLRQCPAIERIAVLTPQRGALAEDLVWIADAGRGLNEALHGARPVLARAGAHAIAIVAADLPFLTPEDISALVSARPQEGTAIGTDRRESGTNALCIPPRGDFVFHFGPGSLARHVDEAAARGMPVQVVRQPGLAFDIDEPDDLAAILARKDPRFAFLA